MKYILEGNAAELKKVLQENKLRAARGVIKFTPYADTKVVKVADVKKVAKTEVKQVEQADTKDVKAGDAKKPRKSKKA